MHGVLSHPLVFIISYQGGPQADRYKWRDIGSPYEWPKINRFHWGYFTPISGVITTGRGPPCKNLTLHTWAKTISPVQYTPRFVERLVRPENEPLKKRR